MAHLAVHEGTLALGVGEGDGRGDDILGLDIARKTHLRVALVGGGDWTGSSGDKVVSIMCAWVEWEVRARWLSKGLPKLPRDSTKVCSEAFAMDSGDASRVRGLGQCVCGADPKTNPSKRAGQKVKPSSSQGRDPYPRPKLSPRQRGPCSPVPLSITAGGLKSMVVLCICPAKCGFFETLCW